MISVILCCFNRAEFLARALESAFDQTLDKSLYEVIFIDDGSNDGSGGIASRYEKYINFRRLTNPVNKGLPFSCDRGIEDSGGEYIIRLDADDYFEKNTLECFFEIVNREDVDFIYSDRFLEDAQGNIKEKTRLKEFNVYNLIACGVLLKKDILDKIGGYRDFLWEEYDLYIRYLEASGKKPIYIPLPLYHYVIHKDNMTSSKEWNTRAWQQLVREWGSDRLKKYGTLPVDLSLKQFEQNKRQKYA